MKYFTQKPPNYVPVYGKIVKVDHPLFSHATLYSMNDKGILVVQQHFNATHKRITWGAVDAWLANDIYLNKNFYTFFLRNATEENYPVFTVRSLMWTLRMKPLQREFWEDWKGDKFI